MFRLYGNVQQISWQQPDDPNGPDPEIVYYIMKHKLRQPSPQEIISNRFSEEQQIVILPDEKIQGLKGAFVFFDSQRQANRAVKAYRHQNSIRAMTKYEYMKLESAIKEAVSQRNDLSADSVKGMRDTEKKKAKSLKVFDQAIVDALKPQLKSGSRSAPASRRISSLSISAAEFIPGQARFSGVSSLSLASSLPMTPRRVNGRSFSKYVVRRTQRQSKRMPRGRRSSGLSSGTINGMPIATIAAAESIVAVGRLRPGRSPRRSRSNSPRRRGSKSPSRGAKSAGAARTKSPTRSRTKSPRSGRSTSPRSILKKSAPRARTQSPKGKARKSRSPKGRARKSKSPKGKARKSKSPKNSRSPKRSSKSPKGRKKAPKSPKRSSKSPKGRKKAPKSQKKASKSPKRSSKSPKRSSKSPKSRKR